MKTTTLFLGIVISVSSIAQTTSLDIGDELPSLEITEIINHLDGKLITDTLRGKSVLLYFWSTGCSSCIGKMPLLDSLQTEFQRDLFILPVAVQPRYIIETFWNANSRTKDLTLPSVTSDTRLKQLFPHLGVPYVVWIKENGLIHAFTNSNEVTAGKVRDFLTPN